MSTSQQKEPQSASAMVNAVASNDGVYGQYELAKIRISPDNRKRFNEQALQELAKSIQDVGVAQPILIRPVDPTPEAPEVYEIVAAARRYRASKIAGMESIPALCRNLSNLEAAKLRILENLQREDPHPMEEAEGYQLLMMQHGFSAEQLADEVKKSKAYVYARLKLCALTPEAREPFLNNEISASIALLIARIPVPKLQVQALNEVLKPQWGGEALSYRSAAAHIQQRYMLDLNHAVFKIHDAKLLKSAGPCTTCPKRAGNQPEVFEGIDANVCTDPDCFGEKKSAHTAALIVQANKKGIPVHEGDEGVELLSSSNGWGEKRALVRADNSLWTFERIAPHTKNNGAATDYLDEKSMPPIAAYAKNQQGDLVALYRREDMQRALEIAGACETEEGRDERMREAEGSPNKKTADQAKREAEEAAHEKKAEDMTAFRVALYTRIREHMAANGLSLQSLREITKLALQGELYLPDELNHLYGFNASNSIERDAYVDQATMPEVQLLLIDAVLGFTLGVDAWDVKNGSVDEDEFDTVLNIAMHEGIDYNQLHEEMFPAPIDVKDLQAADLVDYLRQRLSRINEIKDKINADRPDLIGWFEPAANELGYVYVDGSFQLQESKSQAVEHAEQDEHAAAVDDVAQVAVAAEAMPASDAATDPGLADMMAEITSPTSKGVRKPAGKKAKKKVPASAEASA